MAIKKMIEFLKTLLPCHWLPEEEKLVKQIIKTLSAYKKLETENKKLKKEIRKYKMPLELKVEL